MPNFKVLYQGQLKVQNSIHQDSIHMADETPALSHESTYYKLKETIGLNKYSTVTMQNEHNSHPAHLT